MHDKPNTAEPKKPRGRFQFRLRTLLVGVVLIGTACGYVAHEASIVRARKTWLESHQTFWILHSVGPLVHPGNHDQRPSSFRLWLGDAPQGGLEVGEDEKDAAAALFPEAEIHLLEERF